MLTPRQQQFLKDAYLAAAASGHIFPAAAACEAALESAWGQSDLTLRANNCLGIKHHSLLPFMLMKTREWVGGKEELTEAAFACYPNLTACFADRMGLLRQLAPRYPHYAAALQAQTPQEFLLAVSLTWSSDPDRGQKCVAMLAGHGTLLTA